MNSSSRNRFCLKALLAILATATVTACSTVREPQNQPITSIDETSDYRRFGRGKEAKVGENLVLLAFSGGGTRASALSYGVLQELRDTTVTNDSGKMRLLDEVDTISSVSGGSFTAAYYGLYRDKIFENYEEDFLRRQVQKALIRRLFNPVNWVRNGVAGFDRTELAIDYYDRTIFHGATFDDLNSQGPPYIDINATDLTTGIRFTFFQDLFDFICTDLGSYSVARAVTASSAVPVAFPSVVLKNHADECDISQSAKWQFINKVQADSEAHAHLAATPKSYRDTQQRPYIHLVDGGIADNLGLRTMIDRFEGLGENHLIAPDLDNVRNVLIILVNAQVKPNRLIEQTAKKPSTATTMGAYTSAQMDRYNQETLDRLRENIQQLNRDATANKPARRAFFTEVSFDQVQEKEVNNFLNNLPTSLELEDEEIDRLILIGRMLLRHDEAFEAFLNTNGGQRVEGAITDEETCEFIRHRNCD